MTTIQRMPRVESLTGLRWFAAFFVFLHHVVNLAPLPALYSWSWLGVSGVTFFFVLSGFVLTWSWTPRDTAPRFYRRRFARIYPLLFVSTLLAIPVFYGSSQPWQKPFELVPVLLSLLLIQAWFVPNSIFFAGNPAAWSLSEEAFFYAVFPFTIRRMITARLRVIFSIALTAGLITWAVLAWTRWADISNELATFVLRAPPYRAMEFLLGMCLGVAIRRGWRSPVGLLPAIAIFGVLATALGIWAHHPDTEALFHATALMDQVLAPAYALIIAAAAQRDLDGRRSVLRSSPLVALGQWSYAFYLVHATVIYAMRLAHGGVVVGVGAQLAAIALALGLSVFAAWLLYRIVEHPLERRLRGAPLPVVVDSSRRVELEPHEAAKAGA